jgi:DNA polymerase III subunit gamma/tau
MDQLFSVTPEAAPSETAGYRVLARKYRPSTFDDLIGQDAMVRTLRNAFARNRIPQAWMLTGVRGVGKTTTARILARGLNYELDKGGGGPTVDMDRLGIHCQAIIEGNHIDVLEIDAASNNGVENIRQITDSVRYAPTSARYKVYIIDEVHMLSQGAFNAFLKTLEEPPPHVKFIFATTEIRKVPVTILSRCQRFDLRRVEAAPLIAHLKRLCALEKVAAEDEALSFIARAAEGSVRDAMSLLDQAIAHGAGAATAEEVRRMLGLADRAQLLDLFESLVAGRLAEALAQLRTLFELGSDPALIISDLADIAHLAARLKIVSEAANDPALTEAERQRGLSLAERLSMPILSRAWQLLSRGLLEVQAAGKPLAAAEMLMIRFAYAANLPTPDEALRALQGTVIESAGAATFSSAGSGLGAANRQGTKAVEMDHASERGASQIAPATSRAHIASSGAVALASLAPSRDVAVAESLSRFTDVIALARAKRDLALAHALEHDIRLVNYERGRIEFEPAPGASGDLAKTTARRLHEWTGERWLVAVSQAQGRLSVAEQRELDRKSAIDEAEKGPLVRAILDRFPGAEIVSVRDSMVAGPVELGSEDARPALDTQGSEGEAGFDPFDQQRDE